MNLHFPNVVQLLLLPFLHMQKPILCMQTYPFNVLDGTLRANVNPPICS
jgi:hypothetical protein